MPTTKLFTRTINTYTAGVAVAQRKKLILRAHVGRLPIAAVLHVVSFAARGVNAMLLGCHTSIIMGMN